MMLIDLTHDRSTKNDARTRAAWMVCNAYLMELDCLYADVIADRYQRFSGKQAILERTGESPIPMKPREENMR